MEEGQAVADVSVEEDQNPIDADYQQNNEMAPPDSMH